MRLVVNILSMHEVTRFIIGNGTLNLALGRCNANFSEELTDIAHFFAESCCSVGVLGIVLHQRVILFERRAAARRVDNDGIQIFPFKCVDVLSRQAERDIADTVMDVQRSAAVLFARREDVATVFLKHPNGCKIGLCEKLVHHASGNKSNTVLSPRQSRGKISAGKT